MPVIPGTQGIKSWSYEILVISDGVDSSELCEDCVVALGGDPTLSETYLMSGNDNFNGDYQLQPIFVSTEMDREPTCDRCGNISFIFSPTSECMNEWHDMMEAYLTDRHRVFNTDYLDDVADNAKWLHGYSEVEERTFALYRLSRKIDAQYSAD